VVNPSAPAINPMIRKNSAHLSILPPFCRARNQFGLSPLFSGLVPASSGICSPERSQ
jgi:hypothetical protein